MSRPNSPDLLPKRTKKLRLGVYINLQYCTTHHIIIYFPEAPKCPEELVDGVLWSATAAGGTDIKPCPNGASGKSKKKMCFRFLNVRGIATHRASSLILIRKKMASNLQDCYMGPVLQDKFFLEFCQTDKKQCHTFCNLFQSCFTFWLPKLLLLFSLLPILNHFVLLNNMPSVTNCLKSAKQRGKLGQKGGSIPLKTRT